MSKIKKNYLVSKRNVLNEFRSNNMTLQELRLFSIYLSKINSRDISTRIVSFTIKEFRAIMDFTREIKIEYIKSVARSLLSKSVEVPTERGGYEWFQLFKRCKVDIDDDEEWYFEIDAHDDALPLMFDFKNNFFKYRLWNVLGLTSSNQIRMYEILKQYEKKGYRVLSVEDLRQLLGIGKKEYPRIGDFKRCVLDVCQQALAENTDIKFTYEPYGKRGRGGKILALKFYIKKNTDYTDPLSLDRFIQLNDEVEDDENVIDGEVVAAVEETEILAPASVRQDKTDSDVIQYAKAKRIAASLFDQYAERKPVKADVLKVQGYLSPLDGSIEALDRQGLLEYAFEAAVNAGAGVKWNYISGIMRRLRERGIATRKAAEEFDEQREADADKKNERQPKKEKSSNRFINFEQRHYDFAAIERAAIERLHNDAN